MATYGKAVVFGNPGTVAFTGLAAVDNKAKGLSMADNLRVNDARDGFGRIFASNVERDSHVITIDIIPFDADGTTVASAKAIVALPGPGATVTLDDLDNSLLDGNWNYIGGATIEYGAEGEAPVTIRGMQLRRTSANGSTAAAQTAIT
jgi:hypothetical protein